METPWITVKLSPGFSADATSWTTWIAEDGFLLQTVEVARFSQSPCEIYSKQLELQLSSEKVRKLHPLIANTNFEAVLRDGTQISGHMTDLERCEMWVHQNSGTKYFCAPLISWPSLREFWLKAIPSEWAGRPQFWEGVDFSAAAQLWFTVDELSPYGCEAKRQGRSP